MKSFLLFLLEVGKIVLLALLIVIPIRYFIFQPFFVRGQSMEPNFQDSDYLIIDELSYRLRDPLRGEVIVFKYPNDPSQRYIKRIIGLPGETLEIGDGKVVIFNEGGGSILDESAYLDPSVFTAGSMQLTLDQNEYFVLGDNRAVSADSRRWGTLPKENIIGRAWIKAWPVTVSAKIETPEYSPSQ